jgi:hypothetical protein
MHLYCVFGLREEVKREIPLINLLEKSHVRRCLVTHDNY